MEKEAKAAGGSGLDAGLPRLVFMGSPDFACPSLSRLIERGADIPLVVTQPDRRRGRGLKSIPGPVKLLAQEHGIAVFQPETVREPAVIRQIVGAGAECLVLVAYGKLLPRELLIGFDLGAINVHPSLLPKYRGAAPIQRSILAGDKVTGASIMLMDSGMDTGPVLAQTEMAVAEAETFGSLHDRLAEAGAELLCETLVRWRARKIQAVAQDDAQATSALPIDKNELKIVWDRPAARIVDTIRALDPWPGAYCLHDGKRLKCFDARVVSWQVTAPQGEVVGTSEHGLLVAAADGHALAIGALQLEGRRRLPTVDFVRGYRLEAGSLLT
jgi:methionyl-tRNA formyltransferase